MSSAKLMIVDDEAVFATDLQHRLQYLGYDVLPPVGYVSEALALAERERPDLILMDIYLAGNGDGINLAQEIRDQLGVPVVFISGYADAVVVQQAKKAEPLGYLLKPLVTYQLRATIELALDRAGLERRWRESEARYRDLVETSQDLIFRLDQEGGLVYLNQAWEQTLGYRLGDITGRRFSDFQFAAEAVLCHEALDKVLAGGELTGYETAVVSKKGRVIHLRLNAKTWRDDLGRIRGLQGTAYDVTDWRKALEALRESETRYRLLVDNASEGLAVIQVGRIRFVNDRMRQILGYPESELLSKSMIMFLYPEDSARVLDLDAKGIEGQPAPNIIEFRILTASGEIRWVQASAVLIQWREAPASLVFFTDVTSRKQAEEQIVKAKREWERTFDAVQDIICLVDSEHVIIRANQALANRLRLPIDRIVGRKCYELIHNRSEPLEHCPHAQVLATDRSMTIDIKEEALGGDFMVNVSALHDDQGKVIGIIHVAREITELKRIQAERESFIGQLQAAMTEVKRLSGLLPICASCKKIRNDQGYWEQIEAYIETHSGAEFSHSICPDCARKLYPQFYKD
ncbi:MAG: PAS domain S-box protein [Thermodesulfobacteriota bacterium]